MGLPTTPLSSQLPQLRHLSIDGFHVFGKYRSPWPSYSASTLARLVSGLSGLQCLSLEDPCPTWLEYFLSRVRCIDRLVLGIGLRFGFGQPIHRYDPWAEKAIVKDLIVRAHAESITLDFLLDCIETKEIVSFTLTNYTARGEKYMPSCFRNSNQGWSSLQCLRLPNIVEYETTVVPHDTNSLNLALSELRLPEKPYRSKHQDIQAIWTELISCVLPHGRLCASICAVSSVLRDIADDPTQKLVVKEVVIVGNTQIEPYAYLHPPGELPSGNVCSGCYGSEQDDTLLPEQMKPNRAEISDICMLLRCRGVTLLCGGRVELRPGYPGNPRRLAGGSHRNPGLDAYVDDAIANLFETVESAPTVPPLEQAVVNHPMSS